jgi:hypothetical protein
LIQERHVPTSQAARALLANLQVLPSKKAAVVRRTAKVTTDPKKLALRNQVELMRIRHCAIAGNPNASSISMNERLHVKVIANGTRKEGERALWFAKSTVTGKVLDLIVDQFGMVSDGNPLQLAKISPITREVVTLLHNNDDIANQVEEGSTLTLVRSYLQQRMESIA